MCTFSHNGCKCSSSTVNLEAPKIYKSNRYYTVLHTIIMYSVCIVIFGVIHIVIFEYGNIFNIIIIVIFELAV